MAERLALPVLPPLEGKEDDMRLLHQLLLFALIVAAIMIDETTKETTAAFSTANQSHANAFTSATLVLKTLLAEGTSLTFTDMVPGDSHTARLTLKNDGTLAMRYTMSTGVTGYAILANTLQLTIRNKTATSCTNHDGAILYGPAALSNGTIGNPAHGAHVGDLDLAAGATHDLCFTVELPATTGTALEARTATSTFTFVAEQL
jgi:hypothetical protein